MLALIKSPVPSTRQSGEVMYSRRCIFCSLKTGVMELKFVAEFLMLLGLNLPLPLFSKEGLTAENFPLWQRGD
jgi:hypothetical protein